jgi:carbamoyltransferase
MKTAVVGATFSAGSSSLGASESALLAGISGSSRNACATLGTVDGILGICPQERATRVRSAGCNATGLPDEALDELLGRAGRRRNDITCYAIAEPSCAPLSAVSSRVGHHFAHACAAFLPSPFETSTIVVCDHESPQISVWDGNGTAITPVEWPWVGPGFVELLSECARAIGLTAIGREQRLEALARLEPRASDPSARDLFALEDYGIRARPGWQSEIERRSAGLNRTEKVALAAALQAQLAELTVAFLARVRSHGPPHRNLCLGGSLFCNTHVNSAIKLSGLFDNTFVPVDPANGGLSPGVALHAAGIRQQLAPFLGPAYSTDEIKATLDNCKLTYRWASDAEAIAVAVDALQRGQLVAWFDGSMEWGPRALGARSILASPFNPYVLDNLNRFLKHREPWRGYALSGLSAAVQEQFTGPVDSPFMECDFVPRDPERFRSILPAPRAAVRVQTVDRSAPRRFQALLVAFGETSGLPLLVNTSFNGFQEPIVCNPRDAVRVFFGSGVDVLILGEFIVAK